MYLGRVVETGNAEQVFSNPRPPYTQSLLAAIPEIGGKKVTDDFWLEGEPPDPTDLPSGCRFRTRCPKVQDKCAIDDPPLIEKAAGHADACHFSGQNE